MENNTTPQRKTQAEIDALVANWKADPCWDLADTEGFAAHRDELQAIDDAAQKEWAEHRAAREIQEAEKMGVSVGVYWAINNMRSMAERGTRTLDFYLMSARRGSGQSWDSDNQSEVAGVLESVTDGVERVAVALSKELAAQQQQIEELQQRLDSLTQTYGPSSLLSGK